MVPLYGRAPQLLFGKARSPQRVLLKTPNALKTLELWGSPP